MVAVDDNYSGQVSGSDDAQRRTVAGAHILKMSVGPMDNNCYLVRCADSGQTVLIDAANDADRVLELVRVAAPQVALIVTTHRHPDHWQALAAVADATRAPTAAHPLDATSLPVPPHRMLDDGDQIQVGELRLDVIHLTGHTPGSIALRLVDGDGRTHLFNGDTLFPGGIGKTWSASEFDALYRDVTAKLFAPHPDDTVIYPGHGADTTLGAERPHLGEWLARRW